MSNLYRAPRSIQKVLSSNDLGLTGGHQAGILVPKSHEVLAFFPKLDNKYKNPRFLLPFLDDSDQRWEFSFIYYNNIFFGGTRNEFRLTRMTKYLNSNNLKVGDKLLLTHHEDGNSRVSFIKNTQNTTSKLILSTDWKIITFK